MIEVWGKSQCPSCEKTKRYLSSNKIDYIYKQLGKDFTREQIFEEFVSARTFPQVKINNTQVGGYEEMITYIETMGLNNKV
jgi:glutaredoxin